MSTKITGYLVILRYGDGPGAAGNWVTHNYVFCKDRDALDTVLSGGGRVIRVHEFSEDTLDSFHLVGYDVSASTKETKDVQVQGR